MGQDTLTVILASMPISEIMFLFLQRQISFSYFRIYQFHQYQGNQFKQSMPPVSIATTNLLQNFGAPLNMHFLLTE